MARVYDWNEWGKNHKKTKEKKGHSEGDRKILIENLNIASDSNREAMFVWAGLEDKNKETQIAFIIQLFQINSQANGHRLWDKLVEVRAARILKKIQSKIPRFRWWLSAIYHSFKWGK